MRFKLQIMYTKKDLGVKPMIAAKNREIWFRESHTVSHCLQSQVAMDFWSSGIRRRCYRGQFLY